MPATMVSGSFHLGHTLSSSVARLREALWWAKKKGAPLWFFMPWLHRRDRYSTPTQ